MLNSLPIKRIKSVQVLANGMELNYSTRCGIMDSFTNSDPLGELTIQIPESAIDPYATAIAIDFTPADAGL